MEDYSAGYYCAIHERPQTGCDMGKRPERGAYAGCGIAKSYDDSARLAAFELLTAPLWRTDRPKLRDRVPLSGDKLAKAARKFLTLSAEYAERETFAKRREGPWPRWVTPLASPTRQLPPKPFESGRNCLPGLEKWARQVIQ